MAKDINIPPMPEKKPSIRDRRSYTRIPAPEMHIFHHSAEREYRLENLSLTGMAFVRDDEIFFPGETLVFDLAESETRILDGTRAVVVHVTGELVGCVFESAPGIN